MNEKEQLREIGLLTGMLDDEDENIAVEIMADLLDHGDRIEPFLAGLQDSDNPLLRKRVQQLETILLMRRRRRDFSRLLERKKLSLEKGLIEVHLQWFDNDGEKSLHESFSSFVRRFSERACRTLTDAVYFVERTDFRIEPETSLEPELYCIGTVLDNRRAAGSLAAALLSECGRRCGLDWKPAMCGGEFAVFSQSEKAVLPMRGRLRPETAEARRAAVLETKRLLLYFSMMLFSHSILSDNFRYIHTIGQSLCGFPDGEGLDFLPYPYCPAPEDDEAGGPEGADAN